MTKSRKPRGASSSKGQPKEPVLERPEYTYDDRAAFNAAYAGVQPLERARGSRARTPEEGATLQRPTRKRTADDADAPDAIVEDEKVRAQLDTLVGRGVHFDIERESDGYVAGVRRGASPRTLDVLASGKSTPEASLDLHGYSEDAAARELTRFVRLRHRRGNRLLLVVHGKGHHSVGGVGVLGDCVVRTLTEGGAAPLVLAFCSAPLRQGGNGALLVRLK